MEAFIGSSKLLKHWPSCLIGLVLLWILRYILARRKGSSQKYTLDNEEEVEGMSQDLVEGLKICHTELFRSIKFLKK